MPTTAGTFDGELSAEGQWVWQGTGTPDDKWVEVQPLTAPVPGTVIPAATTIDAIFTAVFGTRSADLGTAGTPTYTWGTNNQICANWPNLLSNNLGNNSAMFATFIARSMAPSSIGQ